MLQRRKPKLHGHGPAAERVGETLDLDTRPFHIRLAEAAQEAPVAATLLVGGAAMMVAVPFFSDIVLPAGLAFTGWVLTRPSKLPFDLPERSGRKDPNNLHPFTNKPTIAAGRDYLGTERFTRVQIWQEMKKSVQHRWFPGTTGAGKSDSTLSICVANAIAQGSGCILVDGKGSPDFYTKVLSMLHQAGLEDQLLVLNFLGGGSNTTNPFAQASPDMIREIMVGQLSEPGGENKIFFARAVALLGILAPILKWVSDHKGICVDLERIRDALELPNIVRIARHLEIKFHYDLTGQDEIISLDGIPNQYIRAVRSYLGGSGGFDLNKPAESQKTDEPSKQHSFIEMQFIHVFTSWLVSLGHVFRVPTGDVDMFDVVMNRRFLVVLLPSLKSSTETTQGLGKYVVAMLKATMGLVLGGEIEGDYADVVENLPSNAQSAYKVFFDEVGAYATNGMDNMLAMARQLNIEFDLGLQEIGSLKAALKDRVSAVLGNPNTTVGMRLQDPDTGDQVQRIGGKARVAQVTQQTASKDLLNTFREPEAASIQTADRFNWLDLRDLKEGQAIISYGNRLIHANLAYFQAPKPEQSRINRLLMIEPPASATVLRHARQVEEIRMAIMAGPEDPAEPAPLSDTLLGLLNTFAGELAARKTLREAAMSAVLSCPDLAGEQPEPIEPDEEPAAAVDQVHPAHQQVPEDHAFSKLLRMACSEEMALAEFPDTGRLPEAQNAQAEEYTRIERFAGRRADSAKAAARQAIGGIAEAIGHPTPRPERISSFKLLSLIDQMTAVLEGKSSTTR